MFTVAAGLYLLTAGKPARAPSAEDARPQAEPAAAGVPAAAAAAYAAGTGKPPPITHTRITTRPDQHPLLEFMHPALGVIGLGCWIAFVVTRFGTFAWLAFGVIVVTIGAGLSWAASNAIAARRHAGTAQPHYPARLILLHGSAAAVTLALAIVTALTAGRA
jgi:hypothetical protein